MMRISKHYLCPVPTASKNHRCFFSQIFAFPLEKRKFAKITPVPCPERLSLNRPFAFVLNQPNRRPEACVARVGATRRAYPAIHFVARRPIK
jgi:hypothetical protein